MNEAKYIGLDVHQATISVALLDSAGKLVMEAINPSPSRTTEKAMGHESQIELWSPNLITVLLCWFRN